MNSFDPGLIFPLQDVRAREKELGARLNRKHSDIYIVNGSDVSKASSKASTKISKKSSNYDPLPQVKLVSNKNFSFAFSTLERDHKSEAQEVEPVRDGAREGVERARGQAAVHG